MLFRELQLNTEYRTGANDVVKDFYMPLLTDAVLYKRAVGFFSSTALIQISKGIADLVKKGGKIQLIASPRLSEEDIDAIKKGYDCRRIIEEALLKSFTEPRNLFESERLNLLATLIANDKLDIKIAFTKESNQIGIYHEKMGLIYDKEYNIVAFSGSVNETEMAFTTNYEVMDVYCSWQSDFEKKKVEEKEFAFHKLWTNADSSVTIMDFPKVATEKLQSYKRDIVDFDIDTKELSATPVVKNKFFQVPMGFKFHEYQQKAIDSWLQNDGQGIFDMATATGKTYTGLGALAALEDKLKSRLGVFIVCPYQHLIDQWVEDINLFGVMPLICYSAYDWKKKFKDLMSDFKLGVIKNFCVITTNVTFAMDYMQSEIDKLRGNMCLLVDEAHNFGAIKQLACMKDVFKYRLALSATLTRHHDEEGTTKLREYFGKDSINYSLRHAIEEDKLTPYYYYPIPIYLDGDELYEYNELTERIVKILRGKPKDAPMSKSAEMLLIKRARLIAGAKNKLKALYDIIKAEYLRDSHLLVYCGATTVENSSYIEGVIDEDEKRQIDIIVNMLGNELGMRVNKFTSEEKAVKREQLKKDFSDGQMIQVLVAIRCLDEGVNIPGIKTAFILASSTNPKEYIQRRGRVLRKAPNKPFAKIYDFITLPRNLDEPLYGSSYLNSELSLIKREAERMEDFASLAENSSAVSKLLEKIAEYYKLNYAGGKDYGI